MRQGTWLLHRSIRRVAMYGAFGAAAVLAIPAPALAVDIVFTVEGIRSDNGMVRIALCPEDMFLSEDCPYTASAEAVAGETEVLFEGIEPGIYGVQGFHDENANEEMDRNFVGWPLEGFTFANDPTVLFRAPSFTDAAIVIGEEPVEASMRMQYR